MHDHPSDSQARGQHASVGGVGERTRVVYTCWPFGGVVCGASLVMIGLALLLQTVFPDSPEIVWGIMLVLLGVFTILWHARAGADNWW